MPNRKKVPGEGPKAARDATTDKAVAAPSRDNSSSRDRSDIQLDMDNWMISVPFPPSEEEIQARRDWIAARYPEDVIKEIAAAARFKTPEVVSAMRGFLLNAGEVFKLQEYDRPPGQSFAPDKQYLQQIALLARDLIAVIGGMNHIQADSFWHPMKQVHSGPATGKSFKTNFGLTVVERPWPENVFVIEHLRPHQLIEAIQVVRNLANDAAGALPSQRGGRNTFPAMEVWISSAQRFWRAHSSSAFTPVLAKGDPASPALAFCYLAFKPLNGSIRPTQIASAMRRLNKKFPVLANDSRARQKPSRN